MRTCYLPLLVLILLGLLSPAHANTVWVNCHNGTAFCTDESQLAAAKAEWESQGASVVVSPELTSDILEDDVSLVVVALPTFGFDTPTTTMNIPGFLANGGRLVLLAEKETTEFENSNAIIRNLLSSIPDHDLSLNSDNINPGCSNTTTNIADDDLTQGLSNWHFAAVNTVSGGSPLIQFTRSDGGTGTLAAVARLTAGEVILIGDVDGFFLFCASQAGVDFGNDHRAFWRNLYETAPETPIDGDQDGFNSDEDCNDNDPYVNPNETEDCDNLVDDDCDGQTDLLDSDCDETGDDDDTAGGGFGDDDDGGSFDSGSGGGVSREDRWEAGCCGASLSGGGRQDLSGDELLGLLLASFLLVSGSKRRNRKLGPKT